MQLSTLINTDRQTNVGKIYFTYLFFMQFLHIIGYNAKGSNIDTFWKASVIGMVMIYVVIKNKFKLAPHMTTPFVIYVIINLVAIATKPDYMGGTWATVIVDVVVISAMVYLFYAFPSNLKDNSYDDLDWYLKAYIIFMIAATIYNLIKNPSSVFGFINNKSVYSNMMMSFFDNKQTFGMFILMAVICSCFQYALTSKKIYAFLIVYFVAYLFVCLSRTALLAGVAFLVLALILSIRYNSKFFIFLTVMGVIALAAAFLIPQLRNFINNVVLDTDVTIEQRNTIWDTAFKSLIGIHRWVGYGDGMTTNALRTMHTSKYAHNGIVQVLITGGFIKLFLYALVTFRCLKAILYIRKFDALLSNLFLATIISIFIYSMGEVIILYDTTAQSVAATVLCSGFPIMFESYFRNKAESKELAKELQV